MAYREVLRLEIAEVVRRWQAGNSQRNIASGTGLSRGTVRKYLAAKEAGVVQEGPAPTEDQLNRLAGISRSGHHRRSEGPSQELLAPCADQVYRSTSTAYSSPAFGSCWQPEGVNRPP